MRYTWWGLVFLLLPVFSFAATCSTLSRGMSGSNVSAVQQFLFSAYQDFPSPTGFFGPTTELAVKQWQGEHGIEKTGAVGPKTAAAMKISLCSNASGGTPPPASNSSVAELIKALLAQIAILQAKIAALKGQPSPTSTTTPPIIIPPGNGGGGGGSGGGGGTQPVTYAWSTGGWNACTNATQSRTASCISSQSATVADSYCAATKPVTSQSCTGTISQSCTFNSQSVAHGASVTAYQSSSAPYGSQCVSQQRTCTNGTLSGSYTNSACSVNAAASCTFNGQTIANGSSVTAYQSSSVAYGSQCASQTRTCSNGALSGSYVNGSCSVSSPPGATMDDYWSGRANFELVRKQQFTVGDGASLSGMSANSATQIIVKDGVWYRFTRESDSSTTGRCHYPDGTPFSGFRTIAYQSIDQGATWSGRTVVVTPTVGTPWACMATDGGAFYNADTTTWHYVFQCMGADGAWNICHASHSGPNPLGTWTVDPAASVLSGTLTAQMGMPSYNGEGTPDIFAKDPQGTYYVTFHAYDGVRAIRGIAATPDFVHWTAAPQPIYGPGDCAGWNVPWTGGCAGVGDSRTLNDGYYYDTTIEAFDKNAACTQGQHWVLGLVRTTNIWAPTWQSPSGGPAIAFSTHQLDPNGQGVACGIQYADIFSDGATPYISFFRMGVSNGDFDTEPQTGWYLYKLRLGAPVASYTFQWGTWAGHYTPSDILSRGDLEARVDNVSWLNPGLGMNGSNSVVTLPDALILKRGAPWTLEASFTLTGDVPSGAKSSLIAGDKNVAWIELYPGGSLCGWAYSGGTAPVSACTTISLNTPYTVDLVADSSSIKLVVNGSVVATKAATSISAFTQIKSGNLAPTSDGFYASWQGTLSKLAFYDYALY